MAFKILITEGDSSLGLGLLKVFEGQEHATYCPGISLQEWCDEAKVKAILQDYQPAVLINTLQFSVIQPIALQAYYQVLAKVCLQLGITVIHLSSHEVFSVAQQKKDGMSEGEGPDPDSDWGRELLSAEQAFLKDEHRCIVLRLPWIVDIPGGILEQVLNTLAYGESIQASDDWRGCLVSLVDVLRVIIALTQQILCDSSVWGVAHVRTSDSCSELEFVDLIQRSLEKKGCNTARVNAVAKDQRLILSNGWLAGDKCSNGFGVQFCSWRQGLKTKVGNWVDNEASEGRLVL